MSAPEPSLEEVRAAAQRRMMLAWIRGGWVPREDVEHLDLRQMVVAKAARAAMLRDRAPAEQAEKYLDRELTRH